MAYNLQDQHDNRVALVDLDLQFGVAAMCLDVNPHANVFDALGSHQRIDPVFVQALMTQHESGLHILVSPGEIAPITDINEEAVSKLMESLVESYDFVVLDMPRMLTPWTVAALRWADVEIDESSQAVRVRREMEARFGPAG